MTTQRHGAERSVAALTRQFEADVQLEAGASDAQAVALMEEVLAGGESPGEQIYDDEDVAEALETEAVAIVAANSQLPPTAEIDAHQLPRYRESVLQSRPIPSTSERSVK